MIYGKISVLMRQQKFVKKLFCKKQKVILLPTETVAHSKILYSYKNHILRNMKNSPCFDLIRYIFIVYWDFQALRAD